MAAAAAHSRKTINQQPMAKLVNWTLIVLLSAELIMTFWPLTQEVKIKNNLAAWPWSKSARKNVELIINRPSEIKKEIAAWEKVLTEENESRDILLRLSILYHQLYEDEQTKIYWQRAFYLDPELVSSLPVQLF